MEANINKTFRQAVVLGIITGMRATVAPTIASHYFSKQNNTLLKKSKLGFIQTPLATVATKVFTGVEIIVDKLPSTPNRIIAKQVVARVASAAFAGAIVATANKDKVIKGILTGGVTALAATYATFFLRKFITNKSSLSNPVVGAIEDAVAIGSGALLLR